MISFIEWVEWVGWMDGGNGSGPTPSEEDSFTADSIDLSADSTLITADAT